MIDTGYQSLNALALAKSAGKDARLSLRDIVGEPTVGDAVGAIYNPQAIGQNVSGQTLLGSELAHFSKWYFNQFVKPAPAGYLRDFFDSKFTVGLIGLLHAKQNLGNGGIYGGPGAALHAQAIRPITATASASTPSETWNVASVTAGWNTDFFNLDMSHTSTTPNLNLEKNVEMMVFGLADFNTSPKLYEYQFKENGNNPLGVQSRPLTFAPEGDAISLETESYIIPTGQKYTVDVNFSESGSSVPVLIGIQYVTNYYYTQE